MTGPLELAEHGWRLHPTRTVTMAEADPRNREAITQGLPWKKWPAPPKAPLLRGWVEIATSDPDQLEEWAATFAGCWWGLATGQASGVVVLDIDDLPAFEAYCTSKGVSLPFTPMSQTLRGGRHAYFRAPSTPIGNFSKKIPGCDLRAEGGNLITPDGSSYRWLETCSIDDLELAELPDWIQRECSPPGEARHHQPIDEKPFDDDLARRVEALREADRRFDATWRRDRSDLQDTSPSSYCMALANALLDAGLDDGATVAVLRHWRALQGADSKLASWYADTLAKAKKRPISAHKRVASEVEAAADTDPNGMLPMIPLGALVLEHLPPREAVLAPWLNRRELAMIYAGRGIGKTWLNLTVAVLIATGGRLPGTGWWSPTPRKVVYVDGEMGAEDFRKRAAALVNGLSQTGAYDVVPLDLDPFALLGRNLVILSREWMAVHGQRLGYLGDLGTRTAFLASLPDDAEVVILDNLSCLFGGAENDAEAWDATLDLLLALKHSGRTVITVHHAGKSGDQRGTSRREDALDVSLKLEPVIPEGQATAEAAKFITRWTKARSFRVSQVGTWILELSYSEHAIAAAWNVTPAGDRKREVLLEVAAALEAAGEKLTIRNLTAAMKDRAEADGRPDLKVSKTTVHRLVAELRAEGRWAYDDAHNPMGQTSGQTAPDRPLSHTFSMGQATSQEAVWRALVPRISAGVNQVNPICPAVPQASWDSGTNPILSRVPPPLSGGTRGQGPGRTVRARDPGSDDDLEGETSSCGLEARS